MGAAIKPVVQRETNLPAYPLVWLDGLVNTSEENLDGQHAIQASIDHLKAFNAVEACEEYILSVSPEEPVILIVSGRLGRAITPRIHQLRQVSSIYVYCLDKPANEQWAKPYKKIKDIITKFGELVEKVRLERSKRNQNEANEPLPLSIYQDNAYQEQFIYSQLLIDVLLRLKPVKEDQSKFIAYCKEQYRGIDHELKLIEQFQKEYSASEALNWYMKDSFLYRVLNRALRLRNLDVLFLCRFLLRDICQAITQNKCRSPIRAYRSQILTTEETSFLQNSLGSLFSVNSFLSTSIHRELALVFLKQSSSSDDLQRVLLEIEANPTYTTLKPFGFINCNDSFRKTEEVVFTVGSIFRLMNIYQQPDGMWTVSLSLCTDNDQKIKEIFKPFRTNKKTDQTNLLAFGNFLQKIKHINEAEKFFARLLYELYGNNQYTADCYYALGTIALEKKFYDSSLNLHQRSLEIKLQIFKEDDPCVADSYNSIGQIYLEKKDYKQALASYLRALKIILHVNGENHPALAACYTSIGGIYQKQENYSRALECHQKALAIRQKNSSADSPDLGSSHNNLAIIYACQDQDDLALEHFKIALKILQNTLSLIHPELAVSYRGLGNIHEQKGELEAALSYYQKTAVILRQALTPTHPDLILIEQCIKRILSKIAAS